MSLVYLNRIFHKILFMIFKVLSIETNLIHSNIPLQKQPDIHPVLFGEVLN